MSDEDKTSPPPLESDEEEVATSGDVEFSSSAALPASPSKTRQPGQAAATPSNTPVVSLFSKGTAQQTSAVKRSFEGEPAPKDVNAMLSALNIGEASSKKAPAGKGKNAPKTADPEDDDDDEDDDEDEEDEDEEDEEEDYVATPEQFAAQVPLLKENQHKIDELKTKYQKERRDLELKFQELRNVVYKERAEMIRGTTEDGPALPGFWLDALQRNILISQFIEEHDEPALIFLDDISVSELKQNDDEFGFELTFRFSKNPFFSNETLTKKLVVSNLYAPDYVMPSIDQSIGCAINWLSPEQNLTVKIEVKKVAARKGGKKGGAKEVRQEIPQESFFSFFGTRTEKSPEEIQQMSEDANDLYQREWETDFAIASTLRAKVIPDATLWYTGEASDSEYGDDEDDDDEDDEDDDDEEDEDEDEEFDELDEDDVDEDDEDEKPKQGKKKGGNKGGKPLSGQGQGVGKEGEQPECKQQ